MGDAGCSSAMSVDADPDVKLTLSDKPKIERLKEVVEPPSNFLPVVKFIVMVFLSLAVLGCCVVSKIFVITLAEHLDRDLSKSTEKGSAEKRRQNARLFAMLCLIMMIPQFISFVRTAWSTFRLKSRPTPTKRAIFWIVIGSILEVVGLCFFTFITLSHNVLIHGNESVAVMNCVSLAPILRLLFKTGRPGKFCNSKPVFILCGLVQLGAFAFVIIFAFNDEYKIWSLSILSLLLVSIAWTPKMRKEQTRARIEEDDIGDCSTRVENDDEILYPEFVLYNTARTKATMIAEGIKLLLTPFCAFFVAWLFKLFEVTDLKGGFQDFASKQDALFAYFVGNVVTSFLGYIFAVLACKMSLQKVAFALPLGSASLLSFILLTVPKICGELGVDCHPKNWYEVTILFAFVWLSQIVSTIYYVWKSQDYIMPKEGQLFWVPSYNGVLLEQNLLLNRKNNFSDELIINHNDMAKKSCVFICTTMYHEADYEMQQLLKSLQKVDCARGKRQIESHVWFDGAVTQDFLNSYVLQLIYLVGSTMNVKVEEAMKLETPYGIELRWRLPGGTNFHIHLKDNIKVKNKKRWSQVMYMSYVLDFKIKELEIREEDTYILTTDADIEFDPESVEALLDIMIQDPKVGAVCGRTHPLGQGPLVWYQTFDYAIGHWFQKVANHVLGSVLCCPGCFSVYRAKALRDVLPIYSTTAHNAVDFLTKDMGEDRWLCTLMVQAGWRLDYCAAAENRTYCPDNFDEFYKQRRRWIPSTLANLALLISEWNLTVKNNDSISLLFIVYQALNIVSTLIGPATVIIIMAGGLLYGQDVSASTTVVLLILISLSYVLICLFTSQETQLKVAKILTFLFALLMGVVFIGLIQQIAADPRKNEATTTARPSPPTAPPVTAKTTPTKSIKSKDFEFIDNSVGHATKFGEIKFDNNYFLGNKSVSTTSKPTSRFDRRFLGFDISAWYFFGLVGLFIVTALCHPTEAYCLCHGVWYLLCLPSGYLLLTIYSVCNLTDKSWGTRENKVKKVSEESLFDIVKDKLLWLCRGCKDLESMPEPRQEAIATELDDSSTPSSESEQPNMEEQGDSSLNASQQKTDNAAGPSNIANVPRKTPKSALKKRPPSPGFRFPGEAKGVRFQGKLPKLKTHVPVADWLPKRMKLYIPNFERNGYDDTSFLCGLNDKTLQEIGIEPRGHRRNILNEIELLPKWELENDVPESVETWLSDLGLHEYWLNFQENSYTSSKNLEDLKTMNRVDLQRTLQHDLKVLKKGHLEKLLKAIKKLQYPSENERKIRAARKQINSCQLSYLENEKHGVEYRFWTKLRESCLRPESKAFGLHSDLSEKLEELRDSALVCMALCNLLWIILIFTLAKKADLKVLNVDPLGLSFLIVFGVILLIQFLTMLWHRLSTMCHIIARAPSSRKQNSTKNWAFDDGHLRPAPSQDELNRLRDKRRSIKEKRRQRRETFTESYGERTRLLNGEAQPRYLTTGRGSPLPI